MCIRFRNVIFRVLVRKKMPPQLPRTPGIAVKLRSGWFVLIIFFNDTFEVNLWWRAYDQILGLFSTAARSSSVLPPWGLIVSADFHTI